MSFQIVLRPLWQNSVIIQIQRIDPVYNEYKLTFTMPVRSAFYFFNHPSFALRARSWEKQYVANLEHLPPNLRRVVLVITIINISFDVRRFVSLFGYFGSFAQCAGKANFFRLQIGA